MTTGNNEIQGILDKVKDTHEEVILLQTQQLYLKIASAQASWYEKSGFTCPQGCGECCRNFEPDLLVFVYYVKKEIFHISFLLIVLLQ